MTSAAGQAWQTGRVMQVEGERIRVRFQPLSQCERCMSGEGCGAGVFGRLFARRGAEMVVDGPAGLKVGQPVRVGVPERLLLGMALWLYGLPLLAFILAAGLVATLLGQGVAQDALALLLGLLAAWIAARLAGILGRSRLNPTVELLSSSAGCTSLESGRA